MKKSQSAGVTAQDLAAIKCRHPSFTGLGNHPRKAGRTRVESHGSMYEGRYHIASQGIKRGVVHFHV